MTTNFGGVVVVPLQGAGRKTNFGGVVPLLGAIAAGGREGDDQLWGSGRGAIAGCPYAAMASRQTALNFLQTLHCSLR